MPSWRIAETCLYIAQAFCSMPVHNIPRNISAPHRDNSARASQFNISRHAHSGNRPRDRHRRAFQTTRECDCQTGLDRFSRSGEGREAGQMQGTSHVEKLHQAAIVLQQCARLCICIYITVICHLRESFVAEKKTWKNNTLDPAIVYLYMWRCESRRGGKENEQNTESNYRRNIYILCILYVYIYL